jgi:asparaginyl-tRNA synthetase
MTYLNQLNLKFKDSHIILKKLFDNYNEFLNKTITCKGWVQSYRKQSNNNFIQLYDGTSSQNLQIIIDLENIENLYSGTTIEVTGQIVESPAAGQLFEMKGERINIIGRIDDPSTYLPCVKGIKIENLRSHAHLRPKFQSMRAIFRIRNGVISALHSFFKLNNFIQLDPNVITTSDCEGAGEVFTITTQFNNLNSKTLNVDFSKDFFEKQAYLTVSSQLQLEALCSGMSKVYTMNPSFRAEPSLTNRHVASFSHIEWEGAFINLEQLLDFNEDIIMYVISYILDNNYDDLEILDKFVSKGIIEKLKTTVKYCFARITYSEALDILSKNIDALEKKYKNFIMPKWGDDLGSNCERYLCDVIYKKPVIVYNYPKILKSFYMKQNNDEPRTVQSCDVLMNGIGEIIGSSVRESNYSKLINIMNEKNMNLEPLQWYLDLRKNGSCETAGSGIGLDRLVSYCTFIEGSIRDVIPFPVAYQLCDY